MALLLVGGAAMAKAPAPKKEKAKEAAGKI